MATQGEQSGSTLDPATLAVYWNHLVSIANEASTSLHRTAFSRVVTEANDYSCVLCDATGRLLVQPTQGLPGFLGALSTAVGHFVRKFPVEMLRPGDTLMSNDPYIGTSQLNDLIMVTPVFHRNKVVAFAANVAHSADVSGRLLSADAREIHEEGLRFPICKLFKAGEPNQELFELIRANVRVPDIVEGDIHAQHAANTVMRTRLLEFLEEAGLEDLESISREIYRRCEEGMREAIARVPPGTYCGEVAMDGYGDEIRIRASVAVARDRVSVDYAGSASQTAGSLNCTLNYVYAETVFILMCVFNPGFPVNAGTLRLIEVSAPQGSILNPRPPAALGARHLVAQYLDSVLLQALASALPNQVMAEPSAPAWVPTISGYDDFGRRFVDTIFLNGGIGARPNSDGVVVGFPSSRPSTRAEVLESEKPVLVERNEYLYDTGGPGRMRGGPGVSFRLVSRSDRQLTVVLRTERIKHAPRGLFGGMPGSTGRVIYNGQELNGKESITLLRGDWLEFQTPGGGGYGPPVDRPRDLVMRDLENGLISSDAARMAYGWTAQMDSNALLCQPSVVERDQQDVEKRQKAG